MAKRMDDSIKKSIGTHEQQQVNKYTIKYDTTAGHTLDYFLPRVGATAGAAGIVSGLGVAAALAGVTLGAGPLLLGVGAAGLVALPQATWDLIHYNKELSPKFLAKNYCIGGNDKKKDLVQYIIDTENFALHYEKEITQNAYKYTAKQLRELKKIQKQEEIKAYHAIKYLLDQVSFIRTADMNPQTRLNLMSKIDNCLRYVASQRKSYNPYKGLILDYMSKGYPISINDSENDLISRFSNNKDKLLEVYSNMYETKVWEYIREDRKKELALDEKLERESKARNKVLSDIGSLDQKRRNVQASILAEQAETISLMNDNALLMYAEDMIYYLQGFTDLKDNKGNPKFAERIQKIEHNVKNLRYAIQIDDETKKDKFRKALKVILGRTQSHIGEVTYGAGVEFGREKLGEYKKIAARQSEELDEKDGTISELTGIVGAQNESLRKLAGMHKAQIGKRKDAEALFEGAMEGWQRDTEIARALQISQEKQIADEKAAHDETKKLLAKYKAKTQKAGHLVNEWMKWHEEARLHAISIESSIADRAATIRRQGGVIQARDKKIKGLEKLIKEQNQSLALLESQKSKGNADRQGLIAEIDKRDERIEELIAQVSEITEQVQSLEGEILEKRQESAIDKKRITTLEGNIVKNAEITGRLLRHKTDRRKGLQGRLDAEEAEKMVVSTELERTKESRDAAIEQSKKNARQTIAEKKRADKAEARVVAAETKVAVQDEELEKYRKQLDEQDRRIVTLETDNAYMSKEVEDLTSDKKDLLTQLGDSFKDFVGRLKRVTDEKDKLEEEITASSTKKEVTEFNRQEKRASTEEQEKRKSVTKNSAIESLRSEADMLGAHIHSVTFTMDKNDYAEGVKEKLEEFKIKYENIDFSNMSTRDIKNLTSAIVRIHKGAIETKSSKKPKAFAKKNIESVLDKVFAEIDKYPTKSYTEIIKR